MSDQELFGELDPALMGRMTDDSNRVWNTVKATAVLTSVPITMSALAGATFGQGTSLPQQIIDVLNFALTLEYLEDEFYRTGIGTSGLIPASASAIFGQISKHETAHVALLSGVLGSAAVPKPQFDFTGGGLFADVFTNFDTFAALSQAFEDTGVRAYKGQAGNLASSEEVLTIALQIHSVEARHAAHIRKMRGQPAWIVGNSRGDLPEATQPIYNGEADFTQGGADIRTLGNLPLNSLSGAFDEPLSKSKVLAIAKLFIKA